MSNQNHIKCNTPNPDFDWALFEDGWNGTNLKKNTNVKSSEKDVVFCHESYAQEIYDKYFSGAKKDIHSDIFPNELLKVNSIERLNDDTLILGVNDGAMSITVDINKENGFLRILKDTEGHSIDKESFMESLKVPQFREAMVAMDLHVKVGNNTDNASITAGYREALENEFREQVTKNSKAYMAHIYANNTGGYKVTVCGIIDAFMPGSMAAANRITDFDALIGKDLEVMIEKWDPRTGFIVSRKKYLNTIIPSKINNLLVELDNDENYKIRGKITGYTPFGIFVEIDGIMTGMMHKSVISDDLLDRIAKEEIEVGTEIEVYIHKIDEETNRVVLSDLPVSEREALMALRAAEKEKRKALKEKQAQAENSEGASSEQPKKEYKKEKKEESAKDASSDKKRNDKRPRAKRPEHSDKPVKNGILTEEMAAALKSAFSK